MSGSFQSAQNIFNENKFSAGKTPVFRIANCELTLQTLLLHPIMAVPIAIGMGTEPMYGLACKGFVGGTVAGNFHKLAYHNL